MDHMKLAGRGKENMTGDFKEMLKREGEEGGREKSGVMMGRGML